MNTRKPRRIIHSSEVKDVVQKQLARQNRKLSKIAEQLAKKKEAQSQ